LDGGETIAFILSVTILEITHNPLLRSHQERAQIAIALIPSQTTLEMDKG
jgi:hypothetical protein